MHIQKTKPPPRPRAPPIVSVGLTTQKQMLARAGSLTRAGRRHRSERGAALPEIPGWDVGFHILGAWGRGHREGHGQVGVGEMSGAPCPEGHWGALRRNWPGIGKWGLWFQRIRVCKLPHWSENGCGKTPHFCELGLAHFFLMPVMISSLTAVGWF